MSEGKMPGSGGISSEELTALREEMGMRQRALADALDVHPSTVSRYESGAMAIPEEVVLRVRSLHAQGLAARQGTAARPAAPPGPPAPQPAPPAGAVQRPPGQAPRPPPPQVPPSTAAFLSGQVLRWGGAILVGQVLIALLVIYFRPGEEAKPVRASPVGGRLQGADEPLPMLLPVPVVVSDGGQVGLAGQLPRGPAKGQRPPPCRPGETEKDGGCWLGTDWRAPCPTYAVAAEGRCYVPSPEDPK